MSVYLFTDSVLHLTSCLTMAGPELMLIAEGKSGDDAWKIIQEQGKFKYNKLSVPDIQGANVLYINGAIVHQTASFVPESVKVLNSLNCRKIEVDMSELAKADGSLTCCSLLIN